MKLKKCKNRRELKMSRDEGGRGRREGAQEEKDEIRRRTGVILHSSGVCLVKSGSGRAGDYGITVGVVGHVSRHGRH